MYRAFHLSWCSRLNRHLVALHSRSHKITLPVLRHPNRSFVIQYRSFSNTTEKDEDSLSALLKPVNVSNLEYKEDIGAEITGVKKKDWSLNDLRNTLMTFYRTESVKDLAKDQGLDPKLYKEAFESFRMHIFQSDILQPDLHVLLYDLMNGSGLVEDLFPFFYEHAKMAFPHLRCINDLRKLSDLTSPANWYPEARARERKIIYHAGPTNSGKTHNALKRFTGASSGIYCGPLRLLANEVYKKTNELVILFTILFKSSCIMF